LQGRTLLFCLQAYQKREPLFQRLLFPISLEGSKNIHQFTCTDAKCVSPASTSCHSATSIKRHHLPNIDGVPLSTEQTWRYSHETSR
jgi:hypothetical protein